VIRPLWSRVLEGRRRERRNTLRLRLCAANRSARSRLALVNLLRQCHVDVDLVTVHTWPRRLQGEAYLWAIDTLAGEKHLPPW
jgi:hypothetical protein